MRGNGRPSLSTLTEGVNLGVPLTFLFLVLVSRLRVWVKLWRLEITGRRPEAGDRRYIFASVGLAVPEQASREDCATLAFFSFYANIILGKILSFLRCTCGEGPRRSPLAREKVWILACCPIVRDPVCASHCISPLTMAPVCVPNVPTDTPRRL